MTIATIIIMAALFIEAVLLTVHALKLAAQEDKAMGELRDKVDELERRLDAEEGRDGE